MKPALTKAALAAFLLAIYAGSFAAALADKAVTILCPPSKQA